MLIAIMQWFSTLTEREITQCFKAYLYPGPITNQCISLWEWDPGISIFLTIPASDSNVQSRMRSNALNPFPNTNVKAYVKM